MDRYDRPDAARDDNIDALKGSMSTVNNGYSMINLEQLLTISNTDPAAISFLRTCLSFLESIFPVYLSVYMNLLSI